MYCPSDQTPAINPLASTLDGSTSVTSLQSAAQTTLDATKNTLNSIPDFGNTYFLIVFIANIPRREVNIYGQ